MNQLLAFSLSNDALRLLVVLEGLAVPDIAMTEVEAIRSVTGLNVDVALQELVTRNAVTVTDYMVTVTGYKAVTVTGYNGVTGNHDAVSDNDKRAKNRAKVRECRERKRAAEAGYKPVTVTGYKAVTVTNTPPSL